MLEHQDPPVGWPKPARSVRRVLYAVVPVIAAVIVAAAAGLEATAGEVTYAIGFGAGAVLIGHLAGLSISMLRRPSPSTRPPVTGRTDQAETGLAFTYSRWPHYWLTAVLGIFVVGAAASAIVAATAGTTRGWVFATIAATAAVFIGWFVIVTVRLAPGVVVLTSSGIYHRSLVLEHFVPWDTVVDVLAREGPDPWITVKAFPSPGTRERKYLGRLGAFEGQFLPFMVIRTYWLGANAVPAYRALKHYFEHSDQRPRLADSTKVLGY